jgi:hypothetical protein
MSAFEPFPDSFGFLPIFCHLNRDPVLFLVFPQLCVCLACRPQQDLWSLCIDCDMLVLDTQDANHGTQASNVGSVR